MSPTEDPALLELVALSHRHRGLIVAVTVLGGLAGVVAGFATPRTYRGLAVVAPAEITPEGPVEDLEISASRIERFVESQVMTEAIDERTTVSVTVVRDQPPSSLPLAVLSIHSSATTQAAAEKALRASIEELRRTQNPLFEEERLRLEKTKVAYEADLARLVDAPLTKTTHEATIRTITDLANTERAQLRVRAHPLEVLVEPRVEVEQFAPRTVAFSAFGVALGLLLGYLLAFVTAGVRVVRAAT